MALTEKTLELNVTHELLVLGQSLWTLFWSGAPPAAGPLGPTSPPIYASGLSLWEEKTKGHDVKLEVPAMGTTPAQVAFLQFKLGKGRFYSLHEHTIFPPGGGAASRHALFEINNNTGMDQHRRLRTTAVAAGQPNAAIYALPLFTEEASVRAALGNLTAATTFFSVPDVDASTTHDPIVDGTKRYIAISVSNPLSREVRSKPHIFEAKDSGPDFIGEIAAIRLHRAMAAWRPAYFKGGTRRGKSLAPQIVELLTSFVGADPLAASDLFGINLGSRRTARLQARRAYIGGQDNAFDADRAHLLLEGFSRQCRSQVQSIAQGVWPQVLPALTDPSFFVGAPKGHLDIHVQEKLENPGRKMRLSYVVV